MTVPTSHFGSYPDGAGRMERWLNRMCRRCVHGETVDGQAGIGCLLPAHAYGDPHVDVPEWRNDLKPAGPYGLTCTDHYPRPTRPAEPDRQLAGQTSLFEESS